MSYPRRAAKNGRTPVLATLAVASLAIVASGPVLTQPASAAAPVDNQALGRNLVVNGGFEHGKLNWQPASKTTTLHIKKNTRHGARFARVSTTRRAVATLRTRRDVVAATVKGSTYVVSANIRTSRPAVKGVVRAVETKGSRTEVTRRYFSLASRNWTRVSFRVTTATTDGELNADIRAFRLPRGTSLDVDNVRLVKLESTRATGGASSVSTAVPAAAATVVASTVSARASSVGNGTATVAWTINPGSHVIAGAYVSRDGTDTSGTGFWESGLQTGLTGAFTFNKLYNGRTYTLRVTPVVDGQRGTPVYVKVTPTATPTLTGWKPLYSTNFNSLTGWTVYDGQTQDNDNSVNVAKNVAAGAGGLTITGRREGGFSMPFTSGEIVGKSTGLVVPNYFRAEVTGVFKDESGIWPCLLWFRPQSGGDGSNGEIDVMEWMGGMWTGTQKRVAITMHNEYGATHDQIG